MTEPSLDAWLYGVHVAHLDADRAGRVQLHWTSEALDRWGLGSAVLSGLLPLSRTPPSPALARAWLRGLLPEGRARSRLAERAGIAPDDVLGFLAVYGLDTAGAVILVPRGADPVAQGHPGRGLDDQAIGLLLDEAAEHGAADQLISIGGLEAKVVLTATSSGYAQPALLTPSTHIVKLSRPADSGSADLIDTEAAALDLARRCGVGDVQAHLRQFAGRRVIVVRRYDRAIAMDGSVRRRHQEDAAQLLGLDTSDPDRKFQHGKALPSLRAVAARLDRIGVDLTALLALTTFNLAIGNTDAHAKNLSIIHDEDGTHRLAPAYDVAMHSHHQHADPRFAMDLDGRRDMARLSAGDLVAEAIGWGLHERRAARAVRETLERLHAAVDDVDRGSHPGVGEAAWATLDHRVTSLLEQSPLGPPPRTRPAPAQRLSRAPSGTPEGGRFVRGPVPRDQSDAVP